MGAQTTTTGSRAPPSADTCIEVGPERTPIRPEIGSTLTDSWRRRNVKRTRTVFFFFFFTHESFFNRLGREKFDNFFLSRIVNYDLIGARNRRQSCRGTRVATKTFFGFSILTRRASVTG